MSKTNFKSSQKQEARLPEPLRLAIAFLVPPLGAILLSSLVLMLRPIDQANARSANVLLLGNVGLISLLIGSGWYGLKGLGLRGGRPLYASIGFASMLWIVFVIVRLAWVLNLGYGPAGATRSFIYLLLFEAFAVQLWTFGLFFRAVADWRGPLTAALSSGVLFGVVGYLFFEESFYKDPVNLISLTFFILWGLFYGIIRLRTGSLIGTVVVQALQSFTAWVVMVPAAILPDQAAMQTVYTILSIACLIFIWRLWPKEVADYRV
jgi:hypothetical protein